MIENKLKLYVEGQDDVHVISRLLERRELTRLRDKSKTSIRPLELSFNDVPLDIVPAESVNGAIEKFKSELKWGSNRPKAVGLVVDFDFPNGTQANNRDVSVRNIITQLQNQECFWQLPDPFTTVLSEDGFIAESANEDTPRIGIWLMPNNKDRGMLETFLQKIIPEPQSKLLCHAVKTTEEAKEKWSAPFKDVHRDKAIIHTFLAWMDEPGHPFGQSFANGSFDAESDLADKFLEWVKKLFQ